MKRSQFFLFKASFLIILDFFTRFTKFKIQYLTDMILTSGSHQTKALDVTKNLEYLTPCGKIMTSD